MLIDRDTNSFDRRSPAPNTHDTLATGTTSAKGTNSVTYVTPSTNLSTMAAAKSGQITIVQTGTFPEQTLNYSGMVQGSFGTASVTVQTIPHNLPFIPGVIGYIDFTSQGGALEPMPYQDYLGFKSFGWAQWRTFRLLADATNLYYVVDFIGTTGSGSFIALPVRYYLNQQTSN